MLSRRRFATCALCAAGGLLVAEIGKPARAAGLTRTLLNRIEYPGDNMVTLQMLVEIDADFLVQRHTHPGIENSTVLQGGGVLGVKGQPDRPVGPGDSFQVPVEIPICSATARPGRGWWGCSWWKKTSRWRRLRRSREEHRPDHDPEWTIGATGRLRLCAHGGRSVDPRLFPTADFALTGRSDYFKPRAGALLFPARSGVAHDERFTRNEGSKRAVRRTSPSGPSAVA